MDKTIKVCDNQGCAKDITRGPYQRITIHAHHERKLELCLSCYDTLRRWLDPTMIAPGRDPMEIEALRESDDKPFPKGTSTLTGVKR